MKNNKKITIYSAVSITILAIVIIISIILFSTKSDDEIVFDNNNYSYVEFYDEENIFWDMEPILFYEGTDPGPENVPGVSFDLLDFNLGSTTIFDSDNMSYGDPIFIDDKLVGFLGTDIASSDIKGTVYTDFEGNRTLISEYRGSHEHWMNDEFVLFLGPETKNNFYYVDYKNGGETIAYDFLDLFNFPPIEEVFIGTYDFTHFNSFDIWGDDLIVNSRNLSTIFSIKLFNEGEVLSPEEISLNWVLPSDPTAVYYLGDNDSSNLPIVLVDGEYVKNPLYSPVVFSEYSNKIISPIYNGVRYDFENASQALDYTNNVDHKYKFFGQHKVSVMNTLLESNPEIMGSDYNPDLLYLSIFDNHWPGNDSVYKPSLYTMWSDQYDTFENDKEISYTKVIAVNPTDDTIGDVEPMSYKNIINYDNSELTKNDMFSTIISSSIFFSYEGHNYLSITDGIGRTTILLEYDKFDVVNQTLTNTNLIYEVKFSKSNAGSYRGYPVFRDISNIDYGWNLMNLQ